MRRRHAGFFLKQAAHVLRMLEADLITDLGNGLAWVGKKLLRGINDMLVDIVYCSLTSLFLYKVAEIVW